MMFRVVVSLFSLASLCAGQEAVLLQRVAVRGHSPGGAEEEHDAANPFDHAHIVCHSEGCEEVKANLQIVQERIKTASGQLQDCVTHREKLTADLQEAAKARAVAEVALQECATERSRLAKALAQCGRDRAAAAAGLAQCSRDRAKLEAELAQCAEVDRPNAEKALAKCGKDRAALEGELQKIVQQLGGKVVAPRKSSTRRRRRRSQKRSAASLLEMDNAQLLEHQEEIQAQMEELVKEASQQEQNIKDLNAKEEDVLTAIAANGEKFDQGIQKSNEVDEQEQQHLADSAKAEKETTTVTATLDASDAAVKTAEDALRQADAKTNDAQQELAQESENEVKAQGALLQLLQDVHDLQHKEATMAHERGTKALAQVEVDLAEKVKSGEDHEDCDEIRAQVILAKGKLQEASSALQTCLSTKKMIQSKIDAVERMRASAQKGLDQCLETKARLKTAVAECHTKRDETRGKLQECLDRKKVLNVKIKECHEKRDVARTKLQQCLDKKKQLKSKIEAAKAKIGNVPQARLMQIIREDSAAGGPREDLEDALAILDREDSDFAESAAALKEAGNLLKRIVAELRHRSQEDDQLRSELAAVESQQSKSEVAVTELRDRVVDVLESLKRIDRDTATAASAAKAAEDSVRAVGQSLLAMAKRSL